MGSMNNFHFSIRNRNEKMKTVRTRVDQIVLLVIGLFMATMAYAESRFVSDSKLFLMLTGGIQKPVSGRLPMASILALV